MAAPRAQAEAHKRVTEETKRLYSNLLSKPLDERQLARPTFKLIQEIVKSLITETRTLRQVFNPLDFEPADSSKSWDKRRRTEFIQRLIDFAANHKQPVVGSVAAKLVAGLEPVKCNELLQALAKIALSQQQRDQKQGNLRPRTFTKSSRPDVARPGGQLVKPVGSGAQPQTNRASSRQSSATRRTSDDGLLKSNGSLRKVGASQAAALVPNTTTKTTVLVKSDHGSPLGSPLKDQIRGTSARVDQYEPSGQPLETADNETEPPIVQSGKQQRRQVVDVTSESETNRTIQLLRSNLKTFQRVLTDISRLEEELKDNLGRTLGEASQLAAAPSAVRF